MLLGRVTRLRPVRSVCILQHLLPGVYCYNCWARDINAGSDCPVAGTCSFGLVAAVPWLPRLPKGSVPCAPGVMALPAADVSACTCTAWTSVQWAHCHDALLPCWVGFGFSRETCHANGCTNCRLITTARSQTRSTWYRQTAPDHCVLQYGGVCTADWLSLSQH